MKKTINIKGAPAPIGPYSQALMVDNTVYVSGQIPIIPETGIVIEGGIEEQTTQVLKNIKALLNEADMDFSHVVKASIFLKDMNDFAMVNEIYSRCFSGTFPARETVQVSRLPKDVSIEISVIAIK